MSEYDDAAELYWWTRGLHEVGECDQNCYWCAQEDEEREAIQEGRGDDAAAQHEVSESPGAVEP